MPTHVQMNNGEVLFTYDALGNKWYKRVGDYQRDEKHGTAYIFGMQYEFKYNDYIQYDWKLMFIGTDEGYVSAVYPEGIDNEFKFQYVYNHTDHLGNIRQNITRENGRLTVLREHNYYPFGLLHRGYNEEKEDLKYDKEQDFIFTVQAQAGRYKYKFQGQERQEDLNLGWDSFKYRNYDYAIGRFFNVDPLAEKFPYNGVYNFSENRVVDGVELEGLEVVIVTKRATLSVYGAMATETGIAIGPDGVKIVGVLSAGGSTSMDATYGLSVTFYPWMESVYDAAGSGFDAGVSWGEGVVSGFGISYSFSGHVGVYGFRGIGLKSNGVSAEGFYTYTIMSDDKAKVSEFLDHLTSAENVLTKIIEKQKTELADLVDQKNKSEDKEEQKELQHKIDEKIQSISKYDKALSMIREEIKKIKSDDDDDDQNQDNEN